MPTEATVAHVLVSRYADHLPLYRQAQILARQGIEIGREVLADWVGTAAPRDRARGARACARSCWPRRGCSPTRPPCRCSTRAAARRRRAMPGRSRATTGPGAAADPPAVVFHYAPGRGAEHAEGAAGRLPRASCNATATPPTRRWPRPSDGITLAFCWSHVRREFIELAKGKTAPIATETLQRIAALYAIEAEVRGKPPDVRRAVRQAQEPAAGRGRCSPGSRRSSRACPAAARPPRRSATR